MARLVKILEVQPVIPHLIDGRTIERFLADFEFDCEDHRPDNENGIDTPSHSRNVELEEDGSGETDELRAQKFDLREPCVSLSGDQGEVAVSRKLAQHSFVSRIEKLRNRSAVPKPRVTRPVFGHSNCFFHAAKIEEQLGFADKKDLVKAPQPGQVIMPTMGKTFQICVEAVDLGQILDGLRFRHESWAKTAIFLRDGFFPDEAFVCEECSDPREAQRIADHYQRIICALEQIDEQGGW